MHWALYDLTYEQLETLLTGWGEPRFRAEQVWRWLYRSLVDDVAAMGNIPKSLRARLAAETDLRLLTPIAHQESADGRTRKVLFRLRDGQTIESVLMRYDRRRTVCVSTQVGCGMGCVFCATGQSGLTRNLSPGEIIAQVLHFARRLRPNPQSTNPQSTHSQFTNLPITNIVLMGMGEPLANYEAVRQAIATWTDEQGFRLGARRITLSTVGLIPGIRRLAEEGRPINLAVSLHAADDALRNRLVPINRRYPLADLLAAMRHYVEKTHRRVTVEYALIAGVNDAPAQARQLADRLHGLLCHVNLIPLNPTPAAALRPSPRARVEAFRDELAQAGIPVTVRLRRGIEIEAGCGQLRQREM